MKGRQMRLVRRLFAGPLVVLIVAVSAVGVSDCGSSPEGEGNGNPEEDEEQGGTLTVYAATQLSYAFAELARTFEEEHPDVEVKLRFGSSSDLLQEIKLGAPAADVYASADRPSMDEAIEDGLVAEEPETFVKNREVIVVPAENPAGIESLRDLSESSIQLVLAKNKTPAAEYSSELLARADDRYDGDFGSAVVDNIVFREADVTASVNRVVASEADATFAYQSNITPEIRDDVQIIKIPEELHIDANYPIAPFDAAETPELAREWVELVSSEEGQQLPEQ